MKMQKLLKNWHPCLRVGGIGDALPRLHNHITEYKNSGNLIREKFASKLITQQIVNVY